MAPSCAHYIYLIQLFTHLKKLPLLDENLPTVHLNVEIGRDYLWAKTVASFVYVYALYKDDYDWVIKADNDT
jgi:hypothetical protein